MSYIEKRRNYENKKKDQFFMVALGIWPGCFIAALALYLYTGVSPAYGVFFGLLFSLLYYNTRSFILRKQLDKLERSYYEKGKQ